MIIVRKPLDIAKPGTVLLTVARGTLAKRRWRICAADGTEFGFDLEEPLQDGSIVHASGEKIYVVRQLPEAVLEIGLGDPRQAAQLGWMLGNLHFVVEITGDAIRVIDDVAVRQMFKKEGYRFKAMNAVFKPITGEGRHHHH